MCSYTISVEIEKSSVAHVAALKLLAEHAGAIKDQEAWLEGGHRLLMSDFPRGEDASAFCELQARMRGRI